MFFGQKTPFLALFEKKNFGGMSVKGGGTPLTDKIRKVVFDVAPKFGVKKVGAQNILINFLAELNYLRRITLFICLIFLTA